MHSFAVISNPKTQNVNSVELPSSKSLSNRLLIIRHLADSSLQVRNLSSSDDTVLLNAALQKVKQHSIFRKSQNTVADMENDYVGLKCKNAGTVCRFLISLLSITSGKWLLNADERMQCRPMLPLIECLKSLGADIESLYPNKIFPLQIKGKQLKCKGLIKLPSNQSSQFISSLAMIAPYIEGGLQLEIPDSQVSYPYIKMTLALMHENGADVRLENNILYIGQKQYGFQTTEVETDWSAAAFLYSIVALGKIQSLKIKGLRKDSLQGDAVLADVFSRYFGVHSHYDSDGVCLQYSDTSVSSEEIMRMDFISCPDLFLPLAATAVCLNKPFVFKGLETLVYKESDRLGNMIFEMRKAGFEITHESGEIIFKGAENRKDSSTINFEADSYNDHRMAMAISLFAFKYKNVKIKNPDCVNKSFPDYWQMLSNFFEVELI